MSSDFPHQNDGPATSVAVATSVQDVVGIPELGSMIMGFLATQDSLRSASLTSKRFNLATRYYLWRAIELPYIELSAEDLERCPAFPFTVSSFLKNKSYELRHYTHSLSVNMGVIAPDIFKTISTRRWELDADAEQDKSGYQLNRRIDLLFHHLQETLLRTPLLQAFKCRDVPRILDLMILLKNCPAIKSIQITACTRDNIGLRPYPATDVHQWNSWCAEDRHLQVPLANLVNLRVNAAIEPVFNYSTLRILSLTNIQHDGLARSPYLGQLVSLLKASPNLTHLELSARHQYGGFTSRGSFLANDRRSYSDVSMLQALCILYEESGGQPLHIKGLKLGYGSNPEWYDTDTTPYLHALTDCAYLKELHLDNAQYDLEASCFFGKVKPN